MGNKFLALFIGVLLCSLSIYGQATATGSLAGTVTDKSGAVVPNASVKISNKDTGLARETTTGAAGVYRFDLLPAGTYTLTAAVQGFATSTIQNVGLFVGQTTTIDVSLSPGSVTETVMVEATGAPLVDTDRSDVSLPITSSQIENLPLNGRDFANLAYLAPGARPVDSYDPTKNRIAIFGINGSSGRNVNVTVNGIDNKDNTVGGPVMQFPLEAIQEFLISTQRFSAANGRSEGAAVNVITKAGTNEYHGSLYYFDRRDVFQTNDYFSDKGGQSKPPFLRQQFGGSIGGPVRKDKDFLFFTLEREREQTSIPVNPDALKELSLVTQFGAVPSPVIPTPYYDWRYNGRYDHRFNEKHNLFMTYSNQNNRGLNDQSGQTNDLTAGNFTTNQLILANVTLNSVLSPRVVNSFTAGYQYWNNLIDSEKKVPTVTFPNSISFGTNTNVPQQSYQVKWQFRDDISITRGKHTIRTGLDYLWEPKLGGFFEFNPTLEIDFLDLPSVILSDKKMYPQGFQTPGAVVGMSDTAGNPYFDLPNGAKMFGVYVQDDWKASKRLTLNFGLRWDKDFNLIGGSAQARNRTYLALKAINSSFAGRLPHDDNKDFSPRVGFAYDLTGSGKHVIRGGYGIYYGQVFLNIPLFMIQQINPTLFTTVLGISSSGPGDATADTVRGTNILLSNWRFGIDPLPIKPPPPTNLSNGDTGRLEDPFYRNPYTQQANIGYSWQLTPSSVVEVDYIHTLGLHESKNININPKRVALGGARQLQAAFKAAGQPQLARIAVDESIGRSRYDGLNISYRRRLASHFSLNTNYVFSKAVAYNGNAAAFGNRPTNPDLFFGPSDFGPVPNDERHRWVVSGVVDLPWGFRISPIMQLASARPYTATQGRDVFGIGNGYGAAHVILLKDQPNNLLATKDYSVTQLQSCLASGGCFQAPFANLRGQTFFQLDARITKILKFGERAHLELFFQAFDLTDRANFGNNFVGNVRSTSFRQPNGFITPNGVIVPHSFAGEFGATFRF